MRYKKRTSLMNKVFYAVIFLAAGLALLSLRHKEPQITYVGSDPVVQAPSSSTAAPKKADEKLEKLGDGLEQSLVKFLAGATTKVQEIQQKVQAELDKEKPKRKGQ